MVWAIFGPEPRLAYALSQRGGRADYRLSMRARARHADVDHGRRRARGEEGVLIKNAEALEALEKVDTRRGR